jgi:sulfide:quinone oxidoreductase
VRRRSAAAGLGLQPAPAQAARQATQAHIVIAGSGLAGIAVAHRLQGLLDGAKITIIDAKQVHNYQPGYTLVASGVWPVDKVVDSNASLQPAGVQWVREMVAEFDPAANTVVTAGGQRIRYDFLVVATGTHQDWAQIEGMDTKAIGQDGLASVYPSSDAAVATWAADASAKGGQAVMTLPATPLKCAARR